MRYFQINDTIFEIQPEGMPIEDMLLAVAKVSYETAVPRGLGHLQQFETSPSQNTLKSCIQYKDEEPVLLVMDYISGRDCRTKVFKGSDGKWYFDSYAFQQRKVTAEEFLQGIVRDPAEPFLDGVVQEIERGKN